MNECSQLLITNLFKGYPFTVYGFLIKPFNTELINNEIKMHALY